MNRVIKFRAWDKGHKKMVYKVNLYSMNPRGEMDKAQLDNQQVMKGIGFACEVMQFTGLLDKNGKEIYDGDKVKRRVWIVEGKDYMDYTCEVRWNGWCYALFVSDKQLWSLDPITAQEVEIIGNVFEHPHLLTPKQ